MPDRVVVFIDAQNIYHGARRAFFDRLDYHVKGQFRPYALGQLLARSGRPGTERVLKQVRVYSGRPDATKQPKAYSAHMKQCAAWKSAGAFVVTRMVRYPHNWPQAQEKEHEKGIDVALAIDFVAMAIDDEYDVGVIASTDTDLTPALEYVARKYSLAKTVEVAAWRSERARGRLTLHGRSIWCHWLDFAAYNMLADPTEYTQ